MERAWVYLIFDTGDGVIEILEAICWHLSLHVERALRQAQQFSNWGSNIFAVFFGYPAQNHCMLPGTTDNTGNIDPGTDREAASQAAGSSRWRVNGIERL